MVKLEISYFPSLHIVIQILRIFFHLFQENSFLQNLGHVELDLPEPPEKATVPPPQAVDPYLRYGPKPEITHIFRTPEKRPPQELSFTFLALVLLPLIGFLVGVSISRTNLFMLLLLEVGQRFFYPLTI